MSCDEDQGYGWMGRWMGDMNGLHGGLMVLMGTFGVYCCVEVKVARHFNQLFSS
jgi:hypothetical protein